MKKKTPLLGVLRGDLHRAREGIGEETKKKKTVKTHMVLESKKTGVNRLMDPPVLDAEGKKSFPFFFGFSLSDETNHHG
jgi:hypothetical protein